jgi:tRNA dimethylallyltransferase
MNDTTQLNGPDVVAILGATATGKSERAIRVAQQFSGEIVSVDSRYLYRGLDIGTAKPSRRERSLVPHHLIDILDPEQDYALALFQKDAMDCIANIHQRSKLPVLAGGSPLYVRAVLEGWKIPQAEPDPEFRGRMRRFVETHGNDALHQRLTEIDPAAAERIDPKNIRRVIRALEIHHRTGQRMTDLEGRNPPNWNLLKIGLHLDREHLFGRIDQRVDQMIARGLVQEVRNLLDSGVSPDCSAMRSIGYQEVVPYLRGEYTENEMVERIKFATHRYVRHQLTWLRKVPDIVWIDMGNDGADAEIERLIHEHVAK